MNTHDIKLPPLPDIPASICPWSHSEDLVKKLLEAYATTAIVADRNTTSKQLSAYKHLTESLEKRLTLLQAQHDELKKSNNPELLASERAANAIMTAELEADRQKNNALIRCMPEVIAALKATGCNESLVSDIEKSMCGECNRQESEPAYWKITKTDGVIFFDCYHAAVENYRKEGWIVEPLYTAPQPQARGEPDVLPGEAALGFAAWLTSLKTPVTFSECHGAAIGADLAAAYNKSQGFDEIRQDFHERLKPYPEQEPAQPTGSYVVPMNVKPVCGAQNGIHEPQSQQQTRGETVLYQSRMRPIWAGASKTWSPWESCTKDQANDYRRVKVLRDWEYEVRELYTAPQIPEGYVLIPIEPTSKQICLMALEIQGVNEKGVCRTDDPRWPESVAKAEATYKAMLEAAPQPQKKVTKSRQDNHDNNDHSGADGYAYRYRHTNGGTVLRFNNGEEVNGSKPIEAVPFWFAPQPQQIPEGYKLVPINPTNVMLQEAQKAWLNDPMCRTTTIYRAMLEAAPQPKQQTSEPVASGTEDRSADDWPGSTLCEKCRGNGEIVTDWDRYKNPRRGDVGDEAVAECPNCDGTGQVESNAEQPQQIPEGYKPNVPEPLEYGGAWKDHYVTGWNNCRAAMLEAAPQPTTEKI